jgi:hypothetical protein
MVGPYLPAGLSLTTVLPADRHVIRSQYLDSNSGFSFAEDWAPTSSNQESVTVQ